MRRVFGVTFEGAQACSAPGSYMVTLTTPREAGRPVAEIEVLCPDWYCSDVIFAHSSVSNQQPEKVNIRRSAEGL